MNNQEKIFEGKRRLLHYFVSGSSSGVLIPDTPAARKRAMKNGATFFSTLSFCRPHTPGLPAPQRWGDLHLRVSMPGNQSDEEFNAMRSCLSRFLSSLGVGSGEGLLVKPEGKHGFRLVVPAWSLGLEGGHALLAEVYESAADAVTAHLKHYGFENYTCKSDGFYAPCDPEEQMPFSIFMNSTLEDYLRFEKSQDRMGEQPRPPYRHRPIPSSLLQGGRAIWRKTTVKKLSAKCEFLNRLKSGQPSENDIKLLVGITDLPQSIRNHFLTSAIGRMGGCHGGTVPTTDTVTQCAQLKEIGRCRKAQCLMTSPGELIVRWPQVAPFHPIRNDIDTDALKCAIAIIQKMECRGVSDFQARDAHRLVRGTYRTINEVEKGLAVLKARGLLVEANMPDYAHVGRRPSPWFLVNPKGRGNLFLPNVA